MIPYTIDIAVKSRLWPPLEKRIRKAAFAALEASNVKPGAEVSIVLADDEFVRELNHKYRDKDKPTNVLSFPADEEGTLGDVILAYETIEAEAAAQDKQFDHHLMHLIIHGILHLIGHDHESEKEAEHMESIEIRILESFGVKNPYAE